MKIYANFEAFFLRSECAFYKVSGSSAFLYWSQWALAPHLRRPSFIHRAPWPHLMLALGSPLFLGNAEFLLPTFYSYHGLLKKKKSQVFWGMGGQGSGSMALQFPQTISRLIFLYQVKFKVLPLTQFSRLLYYYFCNFINYIGFAVLSGN